MRLTKLEARFLLLDKSDAKLLYTAETLAEAQGVIFLCPKCFVANGGDVGTHSVICWFRDRGVPDDQSPKPGRWAPEGTGLEDLTFVPGNPPTPHSVLITSGCNWHGYVTNGDAT